MKRFRLTPAESVVLGTCHDIRSMIRVAREARRELQYGSGRPERLNFSDTLRYVVLLGVKRQPILFLLGPIVAVGSIVIMIYQALRSVT